MSNFQKPGKNTSRLRELREFPAIGGEDLNDLPAEYHRTQNQQNFGANNSDFDHFKITQEEEEELRLARQEKSRGRESPISQPVKTRIEFLADIGKMTRDVKIGENTFTLRTLKSRESREVYLFIMSANNKIDEAYNIKYYTLAYSLTKIDGQPLEFMVPIKIFEDRIKALEGMEDSLTDKLYQEYSALKTSSEEAYNLKTDEDVKEVSEALKK